MGVTQTTSRRTKRLFIVGIIITCLGIFVISVLVRQTLMSGAFSKVPTYQTVLPKTKSIDSLGGWQVVRPPKNKPLYVYYDSIDGVDISVSQQQLPDEFKDNIDGHVAEIAKNFNATTKVDIGNTQMYIGTSAKGPQSVIVAKNNLLILIKSKQKISNDDWVAYLKTLE